jgi:hypothetical protein
MSEREIQGTPVCFRTNHILRLSSIKMPLLFGWMRARYSISKADSAQHRRKHGPFIPKLTLVARVLLESATATILLTGIR